MAHGVSIKKNFLYSGFLTTANYLFTFITYPYVSRVLGVERIGTVNFIDSTINYFIMLSMLGIAIVGIREVAKAKRDQAELDCTYSSILAVNGILTLIVLLALGVAYLIVPQLGQHGDLLAFGAVKLVANMFLLDWVVKGLEDFRIITLRTFAVRMLYVAAVFLFVREATDYSVYYLLTAATVVLNALFNMFYLRRFVHFSFRKVNLRLYLMPILTLGLYMVFSDFYRDFNTMLLGMYAGDVEVGYYTTATKLFTILLSLFTAFCGVMLPRMSSLLSEGKTDEYTRLLDKSVTLLYAVSLPIVAFAEIHADGIISLISGKGYEGAILPMRLCLPLLVLIGHSKILLQQGLMPLGKDRAIFIVSLVGGTLAIALCFTLIPRLQSMGSAILWIVSEAGVNVTAAWFMRRYTQARYPSRQLAMAVVMHLPLLAILYWAKGCGGCPIPDLFIGGVIVLAYCFTLQCLIIKDPTIRRLCFLKNG